MGGAAGVAEVAGVLRQGRLWWQAWGGRDDRGG